MTIKNGILDYIKRSKYFSLSSLIKEKKVDARIAKNYLSTFKKQGIIFEAGYGAYTTLKREFQISSVSRVETIARLLKKSFPFADFIIWDTRQLQSLYHHTQAHHLTFIETEKELISPFFEAISKNYRGVFVERRSRSYFGKLPISSNPVVVRRMIRRSPHKGIKPSLEKILVDMFVDLNLYNYISEVDYWQIWRELCSQYRINIGTVVAYSKRRKCFKALFSQLIENNILTDMTFGAYFNEVAKVIKKQ
jgi:hypothetical protein